MAQAPPLDLLDTVSVLYWTVGRSYEYVACVGEDREWYRWPAVEGGWSQRQKLRNAPTDRELRAFHEPSTWHVWLSLRLSGYAP
jgi:hypothetical protein